MEAAMVAAPSSASSPLSQQARDHRTSQKPGTADDQRIQPHVVRVNPSLAEPGLHSVACPFGLDSGLSDRVVWSQTCHGTDVMLGGINAVGIKQDEPMQRPALAELLVRELAHDAGKTTGWLSRSEHRCEKPVLDRPFPRPLLGLTVRKVPPGTTVEELQLGYRRPVVLVEVGAPAGDARLQAVTIRDCRMIGCVRRHVFGHSCHENPPSCQLALTVTTGLMTSSSLDGNMWYPSAMCSSGIR